MDREAGPVAAIFRELVAQGHITPMEHMEDMRPPGEFDFVPTIVTYGTPDAPVQFGVHRDAQLEQRSQGDFRSPDARRGGA
jgi:hypothetical protein